MRDPLVRKVQRNLDRSEVRMHKRIAAQQRMARLLKMHARRPEHTPEERAIISAALLLCRKKTRQTRLILDAIDYDRSMLANCF